MIPGFLICRFAFFFAPVSKVLVRNRYKFDACQINNAYLS